MSKIHNCGKYIAAICGGWWAAMSGALSIPFAFLALHYWKDTPGKVFALLATAGLLVFVIGLVRQNLSLAKQNRPFLEPKLIIDAVNLKKLWFHFEINNTGNAPATDITYQADLTGYFSATTPVRVAKHLDPGGALSIGSELWIPLPHHGLGAILDLVYNRNSVEFQSSHRFLLDKGILKPGTFSPNDTRKGKISIKSIEDVKRQKANKALELCEGTIAFYVQKHSGIIQFTNPMRAFEFDTSTNHAQFKSITLKKKQIELNLAVNPTEEDHWYFVSLSWNKAGAMLFIDGENVSDPPTFPH